MTEEKLKTFDRVRIDKAHRVYVVQEVDPPGATPLAPSTYIVIIVPEDGKGPALQYGNHRLNKLD